MEPDPYAAHWRRLREAVLDGPGVLSSERRRAIAGRAAGDPRAPAEPEAPLAAYLDALARHAYRVTDVQVAALVATSSEDEVLEATVAAALGSAQLRLAAALALLEEPAG